MGGGLVGVGLASGRAESAGEAQDCLPRAPGLGIGGGGGSGPVLQGACGGPDVGGRAAANASVGAGLRVRVGDPLLADTAEASTPAGLQQAIAGILEVREPAFYDLTYARRQRLGIIAETLPRTFVSHFASCPPDSPPTQPERRWP